MSFKSAISKKTLSDFRNLIYYVIYNSIIKKNKNSRSSILKNDSVLINYLSTKILQSWEATIKVTVYIMGFDNTNSYYVSVCVKNEVSTEIQTKVVRYSVHENW